MLDQFTFDRCRVSIRIRTSIYKDDVCIARERLKEACRRPVTRAFCTTMYITRETAALLLLRC